MREPRQTARRADTLCLLWLRTVRRSRDLTCRILSQVRNYLTFLSTPFDFLPDFISPHKKSGRGKEHPRYGRFIYALAKYCAPKITVGIGTTVVERRSGGHRLLLSKDQGS